MNVYALTFSIGISSGSETFLGLFSDEERAIQAKEKHMKKYGYAKHHYYITPIVINHDMNTIFKEW